MKANWISVYKGLKNVNNLQGYAEKATKAIKIYHNQTDTSRVWDVLFFECSKIQNVVEIFYKTTIDFTIQIIII